MTKTFIFGHKNPDTDSISSALIMADFEQQTGETEAKAYRLGKRRFKRTRCYFSRP